MERLLEVDALRSAAEFASEFAADFAESWLANEQQALLFKVAAAWLLLSLVLINVAWWFYGPTIYDMERAQACTTSEVERRIQVKEGRRKDKALEEKDGFSSADSSEGEGALKPCDQPRMMSSQPLHGRDERAW